MFDHDIYLDVFTYRYGSEVMRRIWSLDYRFNLQREVWVAHVKAQVAAGLVSEADYQTLAGLIGKTEIERVSEIERETRHDIVAAKMHFEEQAEKLRPGSGNAIHQGMTSEDNTSNLDIFQLRSALEIIESRLRDLLLASSERIDHYAKMRCVAFTHWQSASVTTVGHRIAMWAQDLLVNYLQIDPLFGILLPKGIRGAVGTRATLIKMLEGSEMDPTKFENSFLEALDLPQAPLVTGQTYSRVQDFELIARLASIAGVLHKMAFDLRVLQSTPFNEVGEPFRPGQKGSSAMPWKRNPINLENICSLTRLVSAQLQVAWENMALTGLERTLDESGNRRLILPTAFLALDECLLRSTKLMRNLTFKEPVIERNLATFGVFAGLEHAILYLQETHGTTRDQAYEICQRSALEAWQQYEATGQHSLVRYLYERIDELGINVMSSEIDSVLSNGANDVGDAPERARALAAKIRELTDEYADIP